MLSKAAAAPVERHTDDKSATLSKKAFRKLLAVLGPNQNQSIYLRDGEVVLYQRSRSLLYQCRFKLADGTWQRQSTGKASVEQAIARACEIYDEARFRHRLGLAHRTHTTVQICAETCSQLRREIDGKGKKTALTITSASLSGTSLLTLAIKVWSKSRTPTYANSSCGGIGK